MLLLTTQLLWSLTTSQDVAVSVTNLLEDHSLHICLLPANTMDLLELMDISVNKLAKDFLKQQFNQWYSERIIKQLEGSNDNLEAAMLQPSETGMPIMKKI